MRVTRLVRGMILDASLPYKFSASPVMYSISPVEKFGNVNPARPEVREFGIIGKVTITFDAS